MIDASNRFFPPAKAIKESKKPWWTPLCKKTTKEARKAYVVWRTIAYGVTLLPADKNKLKKLEAIKKSTIIAAKNQTWSTHIASMDRTQQPF
jgi:hypothetical protein